MSEEEIIERVRDALRSHKADAVLELVLEALEKYNKKIEKIIDTLAGFECRIKKLEEWREVH